MKSLDQWISRLLDRISDYVAAHRGMPVFIAVVLVVINFILRLIPGVQLGFVETSDVFLHLGIIVGFLGLLLSDAL
jgi:low affinity Fe/Cu permease